MDVKFINLKLLDEQIKYVAKAKTENKYQLDLNDGLLNMLCDIYDELQMHSEVSLIKEGK